jgi:hypothetical protein
MSLSWLLYYGIDLVFSSSRGIFLHHCTGVVFPLLFALVVGVKVFWNLISVFVSGLQRSAKIF